MASGAVIVLVLVGAWLGSAETAPRRRFPVLVGGLAGSSVSSVSSGEEAAAETALACACPPLANLHDRAKAGWSPLQLGHLCFSLGASHSRDSWPPEQWAQT